MSGPSATPLVSIVTPSLDQAAFLGAALESVRAQEGVALEHIVVDGGSRDGSVDLLARAGASVRWTSEPDAGQAAAVNKGFAQARGEIFGWLNADDVYAPGAVPAAVEFLRAHPEVDGVYGECEYIDAAGRPLGRYPSGEWDFSRLVARAVCFVPQPATFLRRHTVERLGGLDESLHCAMDFDYWLRLGARGLRLGRLPATLARLRLHAAAKSLARLDAFGPELVCIFERLFGRDDLPPVIRALERHALGRAHARAAQCLLWSGRFPEARAHALAALRHAPLRPSLQVMAALIGPAARTALQYWRGDPFRMGIG